MSTHIVGNPDSSKPWLVLVHGMSQNHLVFDRQVDEFSSAYRILLIDLPGHGLASDHSGPFGHAEYADHVENALNEHCIDRAHYWGTHTGTAAGLIIASTSPERFASLVLEGPVVPGENVPSVTAEITRARKTASAENVSAAIDAWWSQAPWFDYMRAHPEVCRAREHKAIIDTFSGRPWVDSQTPAPVPDVVERLAGIQIPTLIYNGEFDHPEFIAEAFRLTELMMKAHRGTIPNSGGFPSWEQPDTTNALVGEFLRKSATHK
ncbi:MAG: pimeloyl-ACP methyl ester carboxylesterase [Hyphomicrobiaceae bacterium]|jgi:pimeloyl-ACP methyl ester carboxylesterase